MGRGPGSVGGGPPEALSAPVCRNNCEKDTMVISLVNSMTSLYASVAIFSVMGFKATTDHGQCLGR